MVVKTIGNTAHPIIISDHTTPASGTYAWYIPASSYRAKWPMRFTDQTYQSSPGGITTGQAGYYLDWRITLTGIDVTGDTDCRNLTKALYYWQTNKLLYLSVIPKEMTKEVVPWITYANASSGTGAYDDTTTWGSSDANLVKLTGLLANFVHEKLLSNGVSVGVDFVFFSSVS